MLSECVILVDYRIAGSGSISMVGSFGPLFSGTRMLSRLVEFWWFALCDLIVISRFNHVRVAICSFRLAFLFRTWQPHRVPIRNEFNGQSDLQLLGALVRPSSRADEILSQYRIEELVFATRKELSLSKASYDRLMAGIELGRRVHEARAEYQTPLKISSSGEAISFCQAHFARLIADGLQEEFHIVTLNTKNSVIDSHLITVGTLDASLVHPREVFRPAIKDSASSVLLVHNHPSLFSAALP